MGNEIGQVDLLVRREIEALVAAPLIRAFMDAMGREEALAVARGVFRRLAVESGRMLKAVAGGDDLEKLRDGFALFAAGGSLEFEVKEAGPERLSLDVTRCRYAEMYREHGLEDLGTLLSCDRDYALVEGFNPKIRLDRTRTIMEGADHCDFRFSLRQDRKEG